MTDGKPNARQTVYICLAIVAAAVELGGEEAIGMNPRQIPHRPAGIRGNDRY